MRRASKVDGQQSVIVAALRRVGWQVRSTSMVGDDFPDLICASRGRTVLFEVKSAGKEQTQGQREFSEHWPGELYVVRTVEEALAAVLGKEVMR
ncbi:MAG: hypothetical protein AABZ67_02750 [Pseudomonadota bacterium]